MPFFSLGRFFFLFFFLGEKPDMEPMTHCLCVIGFGSLREGNKGTTTGRKEGLFAKVLA